MFIVDGKSHCCNNTSADVQITSLLAKNIFKKNTNYFYAVRISLSLAILSVIFIQIGYFLLCVSILTHDTDIANMWVHLSVCTSVGPLRSDIR